MPAKNIKTYLKFHDSVEFIKRKSPTPHVIILALSVMQLAAVLVVISLAAALEVGEQAPGFILPSTTGKEIDLGQFEGKKHVLVQFYTMDFQPT